ncbi:YppF family protein [Bacillus sp. 1NLA3E]|uniref:YppF family protein n=1 Tax=Bacillus sp. 1NLA3E TaxID=666686 RepID=UPI000247E3E7|nr:YppF family protein [Bacillus sp. 1NLA3E]
MLLEDLIQRFMSEKKQNPLHVTELHNYIKKSYILGELCIVEYKKLFFELDKRFPELSA